MSYAGGFDYGLGGMQDTDAGGYVQGGSQASPVTKSKNKDRQTLMPVTVLQLLNATQEHPDDAYKIDGAEVHQVKIIGNILKVDEQSTFTKFDIEDSTGVIEVKLWLDAGDDDVMAERRNSCIAGVYVRVVGSLRVFNDNKHIISHDMRPVKDFNEITHHFLDAIHVHCQITKDNSDAPQSGWGSLSAPHPVSSGVLNNMGGGVDQDMASVFTPVQQRVLDIFNQYKSPDENDPGLSLIHVVDQLKQQGVQENDVRTAIDFLSNEGHLYSTIDDYHFRSTADV